MRASSLLKRLLLGSSLPILAALTPLPAFALTGSNFEGKDGNLDVTTSGNRDWSSVANTVSIGVDKPTGGGDDSFGQGSKDDGPLNPGTGSIPNNKDDLQRFYVQSETVGGKSFLYMAWTRVSTLGTANMSIELNQLVQDPIPGSGTWAIRRSPGDLLVLFDFTGGTAAPTVKVSKWVTSGTAKQVCEANSTVPCWGKKTDLSAGGYAEGAVNRVPVKDPLGADPNALLPVGAFGEMAINLTDSKLLTALCQGYGSAMLRSRASAAFDSELKDFVAPQLVGIQIPADPTGAVASGTALGASLKLGPVKTASGSTNYAVNLPTPPGTDPSLSAGQTGPGSKTAGVSQAQFKYPASDGTLNGTSYKAGGVLTISVISSTSSSTVDTEGARQTTTSELLGVSVLGGLVKADVVRAVANTTATDRSSFVTNTGSAFVNLVVAGVAVNSNSPNLKISLDQAKYGKGSYVSLNEVGPDTTLRTGTTSAPALKQYGKYKSDVTDTMIRIHITDDNGTGLLGLQNYGNVIDLVISSAAAHSEFNGVACSTQEVGAKAVILDAVVDAQVTGLVDPVKLSASLGYVAVPRGGGEMHTSLDRITLGGGGLIPEIVDLDTVESRALGVTIPLRSSDSSAEAGVENACVLRVPATGLCTVGINVLRSSASASASSGGASATGGFSVLDVTVAGKTISAPAPNLTIPLPGLGYVTLNEQNCDNGALLSSDCANGNRAGITIRGVHVVVNVPDNPLGLKLGAEVVVTEAHADASYAQ